MTEQLAKHNTAFQEIPFLPVKLPPPQHQVEGGSLSGKMISPFSASGARTSKIISFFSCSVCFWKRRTSSSAMLVEANCSLLDSERTRGRSRQNHPHKPVRDRPRMLLVLSPHPSAVRYSPSSARFPKAIRHISVRAVLWEWMPSSFTRVGMMSMLISWAWRESRTQQEHRPVLYLQI